MLSKVQAPQTARPRPPVHWKLAVSFRKRWLRLLRTLRLVRDGHFFRCSYYGADFLIQPDGLGAELILKRYEWFQIPRIIAACERLHPIAFIDVGAHFGLYSCIVGRRRLAPRLFAFEPDRRTLVHLKTHLMINGLLDTVELHECAAGAKRGTAMFLPGEGPHGALSRVVGSGGSYQVEVISLDDVIALEGQTIVIKIDVES
jgi:FkbM family methyltransferase